MSSRFVTGGSASKIGLSRLVSLRSLPPSCQTPSLPSASSAASSASVAAHGNAGFDVAMACDVALDLGAAPGFDVGSGFDFDFDFDLVVGMSTSDGGASD